MIRKDMIDFHRFERDFESNNKLSESENESDDSPIQEHRIRRAAEFADEEIAHEGNKSTFLRPSKSNKLVNVPNRSSTLDSSRKENI